MITSSALLYAGLGGILPALVWLAFWLREDKKSPEPRGLVLRTFIFGMLSVVLVLPFQKMVDGYFPGLVATAFLLWAVLEESFKFGAAYFSGLRDKEDNEPIDPLIYMITAALGFVALENTLFLINPLLESDFTGGWITGNLRFVGASLLHVVCSGLIGLALGLTFYKRAALRIAWTVIALAAAIVMHTAFNLAIVSNVEVSTPAAFGVLWVLIAALLLSFEKVKSVRPPVSTSRYEK